MGINGAELTSVTKKVTHTYTHHVPTHIESIANEFERVE